jgi:peptidoglycan/LPS O-acetylase OafA/YrhL
MMPKGLHDLKPVHVNTKTPSPPLSNQGCRVTTFSQDRFHVLDGMRGLAAILVMLYHYYLLGSPATTFLAVDFFFILSGFVICHSYGEKLLGGMSAGDYLARRIARFSPMMAFALLLGLPACFTGFTSGDVHFLPRDIVIATIANLLFIPFLAVKASVFPTDAPLWSIFFELLASVAFVGLIRTKRWTLVKICAASLGLLLVTAFIAGNNSEAGQKLGSSLLDPNLDVGWGTENFFAGFPRVFYGFTCGMLLYQLRSVPSPFPLLNRVQSAPSFHPFVLYAALVGMLFAPRWITGYSCSVIMVLAPLLVMQGSNARCESGAVLATSEFLGWLSYPIYCLHMPVLHGMRFINEHVSLSTKCGVSYKVMAIVGTLFLATVSAFLLDRLKVQRNLAGFLRRLFERGWWRRAREASPPFQGAS